MLSRVVRGGLSLGVVRWTGRLAAMAPDKDNTKPVKRRAEIVAEKRAAALAAFQRGPAKNMDEAQVSIVEFRALRVEASRLLRENTRLTHEVTARADGSYASLQATNARLVREVARLQQDLGRPGGKLISCVRDCQELPLRQIWWMPRFSARGPMCHQ